MNHSYDDIIDRPRHASPVHPPMPLADRAAQFAPFAALSGHDAAVMEAARLTESRPELDESYKLLLNEHLKLIKQHIKEHVNVSLRYFKADEKKPGGACVSVSGAVRAIDEYERRIVMMDGTIIPINDIIEINSELFRDEVEL